MELVYGLLLPAFTGIMVSFLVAKLLTLALRFDQVPTTRELRGLGGGDVAADTDERRKLLAGVEEHGKMEKRLRVESSRSVTKRVKKIAAEEPTVAEITGEEVVEPARVGAHNPQGSTQGGEPVDTIMEFESKDKLEGKVESALVAADNLIAGTIAGFDSGDKLRGKVEEPAVVAALNTGGSTDTDESIDGRFEFRLGDKGDDDLSAQSVQLTDSEVNSPDLAGRETKMTSLIEKPSVADKLEGPKPLDIDEEKLIHLGGLNSKEQTAHLGASEKLLAESGVMDVMVVNKEVGSAVYDRQGIINTGVGSSKGLIKDEKLLNRVDVRELDRPFKEAGTHSSILDQAREISQHYTGEDDESRDTQKDDVPSLISHNAVIDLHKRETVSELEGTKLKEEEDSERGEVHQIDDPRDRAMVICEKDEGNGWKEAASVDRDVQISSDAEDWEGIERSDLERDFAKALNFVECGDKEGQLAKVDNEAMKQLYGLQKIAMEGPCHEPAPMALKLSARAKWNAWHKLGSMNPEEAMEQYISLLSDKAPGWTDGRFAAFQIEAGMKSSETGVCNVDNLSSPVGAQSSRTDERVLEGECLMEMGESPAGTDSVNMEKE